jgi:hypothetical protein
VNDLALDLAIWAAGVPVFSAFAFAFFKGPLPPGRLQKSWARMPRGLPLKLALVTAFLWPVLAPFTFVLAVYILVDTEIAIRTLKRRLVVREKLAVPPEHVKRFVPPLLALLVIGCGGSYTAADADANQGVVRTMGMVEAMCSGAAVDAGECMPSRIRGLTRSARCLETGRLHAHGQFVQDAGLSCPAEGTEK